MIEIRIHGRGGQGAVVASTVIAHAAHHAGYHVQVFPEFGVERRGVPVTAFARLDRSPIRLRTRITSPDHVIVLDPALARSTPVTDGLGDDGGIVLNSADAESLERIQEQWRIAWVDATAIAARHGIGTASAPIVNTTMVGAFAGASGLFGPEHLERALREVLGDAAQRNVEAALEAYREVRVLPSPVSGALQALFEGGAR
jgi:pyruvate ferredoxin oxidoreductase gamma subunit/2-oxoisovalerate ferredoxin oxidoreductase gamma subunit